MGLFTKKKVWHKVVAYYNIDGVIYQFAIDELVSKEETKYNRNLFFKKYGVKVSAFDLEYNEFAEWDSIYYDSLDDVDMSNAHEIRERDLENAIDNMKYDFKKKFNDFKVDDTIYTNKYIGLGCFSSVAKVRQKLVDTKCESLVNSMILEIEILDGSSAETKYEFITFYNFMNCYRPGCSIEVVDDDEFNVNMYFS